MEKTKANALSDLINTVMTAPKGAAVTTAIQEMQALIAASPQEDSRLMQELQYGCCRILTADAAALKSEGMTAKDLDAALHGTALLEKVREASQWVRPAPGNWELLMLPMDLLDKWLDQPDTAAAMESLFFETLDAFLALLRNFPQALEAVQCLVTYSLAAALAALPGQRPRAETGRCVKLAKYCTPWDRNRSAAYLCHRDGEVFLLSEVLDDGSCADYLEVIGQLEKTVPHDVLKRHLTDLTAQPCFEFELEKAVRIWLGDDCKPRGRRVK